MIHLLVGPDRYLVDQELDRLRAAYDPEGMNTTRFDKSADLSEVASAAATVGFFGSGRVIVADGVLARTSGAGKGKKADAEAVNKLIAEVAPDNRLILVDADQATVPKAIRDAAPKSTEIFTVSAPRGRDLVEWTQRNAQRLGGSIDQQPAAVLLNRLFPNRWMQADKPQYDVPPSLALLAGEIEKLVLYAGERPISREDIEALVPKESSDQLFAFTDSVFAGDTRSSLQRLVQEGLDDDSAARLLGYAGTQAELALVTSSAGRNESMDVLGKELGGVSGSRLARLQKTVSAGIAEAVGLDVAAADRRLKTGKVRGVQGQLYDLLIARARKERGR